MPAASPSGPAAGKWLHIELVGAVRLPTALCTSAHMLFFRLVLLNLPGLQVIQILLARDKATGQPKGSAYIWFQRRRDADLASEF